MFLSFYITDSNNVSIFQYLINANSPSFHQVWSKLQSAYPELSATSYKIRSGNLKDNDKGKFTKCSLGKDLEVFRYYSKINNIFYWCLISGSNNSRDIEPLVILEDIDQKILEYFDKDKLTIKKLMNNYDRITLIFYWLFDGGEPVVGKRYGSLLKDNIPNKSDLSTVINNTAHIIQLAFQTTKTQKSSFPQQESLGEIYSSSPWRNSNIKHDINEFYIDMIESIHVIFEKKRRPSKNKYSTSKTSTKIIAGFIKGSAIARSLLNGNPVIELKLDTSGNDLGIPSLHECIDLDALEKNNELDGNFETIKFLPPDGRFTLLDYIIDLDMPQLKHNNYNNYNNNLGLINVSFEDNIGSKNDEFQITLNISNSVDVIDIQNLQVELNFLPESNTKNNRVETEDKDSSSNDGNGKNHRNSVEEDVDNDRKKIESDHEFGYKIKQLRVSHGRFENCVESNKCQWIFDQNTLTGFAPILKGCIDYNSKKPTNKLFLNNVSLSYSHTGQLASGIKVKTINILSGLKSNHDNRLFKGVKYLTKTDEYEIRTRKQ